MYLSELVKQHIDIKTRKLPWYINDCFKEEIPLECIKKSTLKQFADYMKTQVSLNTAKWYCDFVKSILNLNSDRDDIKIKDFSNLNIKSEASVNIYLNECELNKLVGMIDKTSGKRKMYLLYFLISAYCGCRESDVVGIIKEKVTDNRLRFVCKKTKKVSEVPVKKDLLVWVDTAKHLSQIYRFNATIYRNEIKNVCKEAGINEMVITVRGGKERLTEKWKVCSSHTARRSFATNLYLKGADIYSICKMMGHSDVKITEGYIVCGLRQFDSKVMDFFS